MWKEQKISIYRDASGMLKVKLEGRGEEYPVKPIRCFPLTGADQYLGLFKMDSYGTTNEEVALISDFNKLDESSKKLIEEELSKTYLLTQIIKIHSIKQTGRTLGWDKVFRWYVDTDKGERTFEVKGQKDIYTLQPNLVIIKDIEGNRFQINSAKLDPKSLAPLDNFYFYSILNFGK